MARTLHVIKTYFRTITTTGSDPETVLDLLGMKAAGRIVKFVVRASSGGGATYTLKVFDKVGGAANTENIIINQSGVNYDSAQTPSAAYFDTQAVATDDDLGLTITPVTAGTFEVRIDFEIMMG